MSLTEKGRAEIERLAAESRADAGLSYGTDLAGAYEAGFVGGAEAVAKFWPDASYAAAKDALVYGTGFLKIEHVPFEEVIKPLPADDAIAMEDAAVFSGNCIQEWDDDEPGVLKISADPKFEAGWNAAREHEAGKVKAFMAKLRPLAHRMTCITPFDPKCDCSVCDFVKAMDEFKGGEGE